MEITKKELIDLWWKVFKNSNERIARLFDIMKTIDPNRRFYFTEIEESEAEALIPSWLMYQVHKTLAFCKSKLGLPHLHIQWVREATDDDINCDSDENYFWGRAELGKGYKILLNLHAPLDKREVIHTIAHEAHHHWYERKYGWPDKNDKEGFDAVESSAEIFSENVYLEMMDLECKEDDEALRAIHIHSNITENLNSRRRKT